MSRFASATFAEELILMLYMMNSLCV